MNRRKYGWLLFAAANVLVAPGAVLVVLDNPLGFVMVSVGGALALAYMTSPLWWRS